MIAAAIDVGTNSLKLLIAKTGTRLETIEERVVVTRLGEGMVKTGRLSDAAIGRTLRVLASFKRRAAGCGSLVAAGTEALRQASNAADFISRVREKLGMDIRIIGGAEEGRLSYLGGTSDWPGAATIEIGGGSAQLSDGKRTQSLAIGAVAMTERYLTSDPPTATQLAAARTAVRQMLRSVPFLPLLQRVGRVVALGGTASTLGTMWTRGKRAKVHGMELGIDALEGFVSEIAKESIARRKKRKGLEPERADIIVAGGLILTEAMRAIKAKKVTLSVRGLRHGLLLSGRLP